jgi:hypothetical protein
VPSVLEVGVAVGYILSFVDVDVDPELTDGVFRQPSLRESAEDICERSQWGVIFLVWHYYPFTFVGCVVRTTGEADPVAVVIPPDGVGRPALSARPVAYEFGLQGLSHISWISLMSASRQLVVV